jgi:hypothetical protein
MEDEDLWGGFMRPKVAQTVIPPVEDPDERGGLAPSVDEAEPEPAAAEEPAKKAAPAEAAKAADVAGPAGAGEPAGQGSVWKPSKENVVWDWQAVEERIVELTE